MVHGSLVATITIYIIPVDDVEEEDEEPEQGQHRVRIHHGAKQSGVYIMQNTM